MDEIEDIFDSDLSDEEITAFFVATGMAPHDAEFTMAMGRGYIDGDLVDLDNGQNN